LTPGPSFAHNLGDKCSNGQCEAIFDIYASRPFQWHQEHLNATCFGPCCRTLHIWESRRTPNPQLWECWASPLHLAKVGLRHLSFVILSWKIITHYYFWVLSIIAHMFGYCNYFNNIISLIVTRLFPQWGKPFHPLNKVCPTK